MMRLSLLTLFIVLQSAIVNAFEASSLRSLEDFNGDGVVDTLYKKDPANNKKILKKEADLRGSTPVLKKNFWTTYKSKFLTLYEWDSNGDQLVDRKEERSSNGEVTILRDRNHDGLFDWKKTVIIDSFDKSSFVVEVRSREGVSKSFELVSTKRILRVQSDDTAESGFCPVTQEDLLELRQFDIFATILDYDLSKGRASRGVFKTSFGFEVDEACFDLYGKEKFLEILQKAITHGAACLQKLGTPKSIEHLHKLSDLMKGRMGGPNIDCQTKAVNKSWNDNTLAKGSIGVGQIWMRPDYKEKYFDKAPSQAVAEKNFSSVIFHEMLHNIGYPHNDGVEYVYTCQRCCNRKTTDSDAQNEAACNICKTDFGPEDSVAYLRQLGVARSLNPAIDFSQGVRDSINLNADSPELLTFLYEEFDDDFLKGVGRSTVIKEILTARGVGLSDKAQEADQLVYLPYNNFINEDATGAFRAISNVHGESFRFMNLKASFMRLDRRDKTKKEERRELAGKMYDTLLATDFEAIDLSGEDELMKRESIQDAAKTLLQAIEDVNRGNGLSRLIRAPRRFNQFITKKLQLKKFVNINRRKIEDLDS